MNMATKTLTTERAVYEALRNTFERPAYAVLPGVANGTGARKTRTIDAVVMSLWPSRGLSLEGVEIKVSRNDFTRELANPAKQEDHFRYLDRMWLAVGDESIVREGELPETWGLLVPARTKLKIIKVAPTLTPEPLPRSMLAAIMRRASEYMTSDELRREIEAEIEARLGAELKQLREEAKAFERATSMTKHGALMARFCERAGIHFESWNHDAIDRAADVVKILGIGGYQRVVTDFRYHAESGKEIAARVIEDADELLADLAKLEALAKADVEGTTADGNPAPAEQVDGA
jgi:hypothetical protein